MSRRWLQCVAVLVIIAAATVSWRLWPRDAGPVTPQAGAVRAGAPSLTAVGAPHHLEPNVSFTPKTVPTNTAFLSADEAWSRWEHGYHLTPDMTTAFGLLNDQGRYHLVWAFAKPGCNAPVGGTNGGPTPRQVAKWRSATCREWTFLNPRTGRHILSLGVLPATP